MGVSARIRTSPGSWVWIAMNLLHASVQARQLSRPVQSAPRSASTILKMRLQSLSAWSKSFATAVGSAITKRILCRTLSVWRDHTGNFRAVLSLKNQFSWRHGNLFRSASFVGVQVFVSLLRFFTMHGTARVGKNIGLESQGAARVYRAGSHGSGDSIAGNGGKSVAAGIGQFAG